MVLLLLVLLVLLVLLRVVLVLLLPGLLTLTVRRTLGVPALGRHGGHGI